MLLRWHTSPARGPTRCCKFLPGATRPAPGRGAVLPAEQPRGPGPRGRPARAGRSRVPPGPARGGRGQALEQAVPEGAIPAATLVLARDGAAGLEILVIERAERLGFAGGAVAFPGGRVDPSDRPEGPAFRGVDGLEEADAAARVAAARETFEEAGVLLSDGPPVPRAQRQALRPRSDRHDIRFGALLAGLGHCLDLARLRPFARWIPPEGLHRRFDTRFYVAAMPAGEAHLADGVEAVRARWARPADLLEEADRGAIRLLFPTRCNVARLAQFADAAALLADPTPAPFVQPKVEDGWLTIPEGIGYPWRRERLEAAIRG